MARFYHSFSFGDVAIFAAGVALTLALLCLADRLGKRPRLPLKLRSIAQWRRRRLWGPPLLSALIVYQAGRAIHHLTGPTVPEFSPWRKLLLCAIGAVVAGCVYLMIKLFSPRNERRLRRLLRERFPDCCAMCGYQVGHDLAVTCPECGQPLDDSSE